MRTQLFLASTAYGLATLAAALSHGCFEAADRRVLVLTNNAGTPETAAGPADVRGVTRLLDSFDAVHDLNAILAPQHPSRWRPRGVDLPIWERLLSDAWGLDPRSELRLVVESIQVEPARALAAVFADAVIDVYADGLMSYGPTRHRLPVGIGGRIDRLIHPELIDGLRPLLVSEWQPTATPVSADALRKTLSRMDRSGPWLGTPVPESHESGSIAIVLGQYLSALGVLTPAEERELELSLLASAASRPGIRRLVFKPHPAAVADGVELAALAGRRGLQVTVQTEPVLAEAWFGHTSVGLVAGCFSTALATAHRLYGLPVLSAGTELVLGRLVPVANSNRIPLVIADRLFGLGRPTETSGDAELDAVVSAVTFAMQPNAYARFRPAAERLVAADPSLLPRYLPRSRLLALGLIGPASLRRASRLVPRPVRRRMVEASLGMMQSPAPPAQRSAAGSIGRHAPLWRRVSSPFRCRE